MNSARRSSALLALLSVLLLGLAAAPAVQTSPSTGKASTFACPVTRPNGSQPPTKMLTGPNMHGNGQLWVALAGDGKIHLQRNDQGEWGNKVPWFRAVQGALTITGRRLDADAPPLHAVSSGYGETGFVATLMFFPTEGCWEITGKAGPGKLTYVTEAIFDKQSK
jgi:hypothetical protein